MQTGVEVDVRSVCASLAIRQALDAPARRVRAQAAGRDAVLLFLPDGSVVACLGPNASRLPNGIVFSEGWTSARAALAADGDVEVGDGRVVTRSLAASVTRWWDPVPRVSPAALVAAADHLLATIPVLAHPDPRLRSRIEALARAAHAGDLSLVLTAACNLIGLGTGLTPYGDDVLSGFVATVTLADIDDGLRLVVEQLVSASLESRTTALSAVLLRHASRGEVIAPVARLFEQLEADPGCSPTYGDVLNIGASSGKGLLAGIRVAALNLRKATR